MQPYIFPYVGYFQLISASEIFVFYDDVNYINKGWINRNRILLNNDAHMLTFSCKAASQNKLIKDIEHAVDGKTIKKTLSKIQGAYAKAPQYKVVYELIDQILNSQAASISDLAINSVEQICEYLGVSSTFKRSSATYSNTELKKADRLIDITQAEQKKTYINPEGGKAIYTKEYFKECGVDLKFLLPQKTEYKQFSDEFVPWLSIIDVLMFNSPEYIVEKILPGYILE